MGLFNGLFKKVDINKVIDKASNGIDKLMFTQEERADFNKALADGVAKHSVDTLNENTDRSKSRRIISLVIVAVYLFLVLVAVVAFPFIPLYSAFIFKVLAENLSVAFVSVIAFHFGGYYLSNMIGKKK
jgi:hypothetical protein